MTKSCRQEPESESFVYRTQYDPDGESSLTTSVLLALDAVPDYDAQDSETVVFDHVDPDALNDLFSPIADGNRNGEVRFTVDQYEVTATAAGDITISNRSIAADD